jgi:hypothetical protein
MAHLKKKTPKGTTTYLSESLLFNFVVPLGKISFFSALPWYGGLWKDSSTALKLGVVKRAKAGWQQSGVAAKRGVVKVGRPGSKSGWQQSEVGCSGSKAGWEQSGAEQSKLEQSRV